MASKRDAPKRRASATSSKRARSRADSSLGKSSSNKNLANKVAVITGAGRGIGSAIAEALAAQGCAVVLSGRSAGALRSLALKLTAAGGSAMSTAADVRDPKSVDNLFAEVRREFGRLDFLTNNAGIAHRLADVHHLSIAQRRDAVHTNLNAMSHRTPP